MKEEVLVTGGAGFLGSHLCDRLLLEKREVICLDNFFKVALRDELKETIAYFRKVLAP